jgi:hypothetical protein
VANRVDTPAGWNFMMRVYLLVLNRTDNLRPTVPLKR